MRSVAIAIFCLTTAALSAQEPQFTRADTLRGANGPGRAWWDVKFYDLEVEVTPNQRSLSGRNAITYLVLAAGDEMQIDLQRPMTLDSLLFEGVSVPLRRDGDAYFARLPATQRPGEVHKVIAHFGGQPTVAVNPPWDGGYQWTSDGSGSPWVATSNQGLGASVWWPNKDIQSEEPDSQRIAVTVPDPLVDVSNGRLREIQRNANGTTTYEWFVANPINNYSISVNAGSYAHWQEEIQGESGPLTMDFWPLAENLTRARTQWPQARSTLQCFEHWFGPYPWYEDGYKLVEVPYLGMEHQSAVTYGNGYQNGYRGMDLSGTGWGLQWDFIVVHESAHEWWGNNVTAADIAENWVHEGFAAYAESLYTECLTSSTEAGAEYVIGTRRRILNDRPVVGTLGVSDDAGDDKYYKVANFLHMLRQLVGRDGSWRQILRGLNQEFRHQIVPGASVEEYISRESELDLAPVFEQYLRTVMVPVLEWQLNGTTLMYRWGNVVSGFQMPVRVALDPGGYTWVVPREQWQTAETRLTTGATLDVDENFYVESREVDQP